MKFYRGMLDALYTKWELYLYRLFKLAKFVQTEIDIPRISGPSYKAIIKPDGFENENFTIPPNPFTLREEDYDVFLLFYEPFSMIKENIDALRYLQREIWNRIYDIKEFLGITANTRFLGKPRAENRLVNQLDIYLLYPEKFPAFWHIIFDNDPEYLLRAFQHFLKDRSRRRGVININKYF